MSAGSIPAGGGRVLALHLGPALDPGRVVLADRATIVAALGAFGALIAMLFMGENVAEGLSAKGYAVPAALAQIFSPVKNFEPLGKGVIDSHAVVCLVLLIVLFLAFTTRALEARRLRG